MLGGVWFIVVLAVYGSAVMMRSLAREPEYHRSTSTTVPVIYMIVIMLSVFQEAVFFPYD